MYKWAVVALLWLVCFFNYADRQAIYSVFPLLKTEMGLTDVQLGVVGASFMWVYAAAAPLAGIAGDRFARKTIVVSGLIFWSLVTVATAVSTQYSHLVVCRALEGLGEAFYFPASMSMLSDYHGAATRSRAMSIHQSSVYAGTIAGGTAAGVMGQAFGWRSSFYLFGILGAALGLVLIVCLREPPRDEPPGPASAALAGVGAMLRTPMVLILMAVFVGANFVAAIVLTWMPSFLYRKFGMSLGAAGFSSTAYLQIASVLGVITGGVLADRFARRHRGGRMITQAIGLLAGVPFIFVTGWTLSVPVLILAMAGFGYFKGLYDANIWASLHDVVPADRRATGVGLMNAVGWIGGGFAPVAIALAAQRYGMSASISASSVIYLVVGLLLLWGTAKYMRGAHA
ncbi:MAG TPA: MFS transporter [Vicinamibacterales bacterium]|jgi:MFS family permease|nr:MFS transporter [Vicinamibacterales bacterium]